MNLFLDSSALVKRYVEEDGSERVDELLAGATAVGASALAPVEVVSALHRRRREAHLSSRQYSGAKEAMATDLAGFTLVGIDEHVIGMAIETIERSALRASDAIHVACAAAWSADVFVSADDRQLRAAQAVGLETARVPLRR